MVLLCVLLSRKAIRSGDLRRRRRHCCAIDTHVQDPAYDGVRTIQIPEAARAKLSGSQKQYWEVKSQYLDVVRSCIATHSMNVSVCAWLQQDNIA